jgi:hypothetical protein
MPPQPYDETKVIGKIQSPETRYISQNTQDIIMRCKTENQQRYQLYQLRRKASQERAEDSPQGNAAED